MSWNTNGLTSYDSFASPVRDIKKISNPLLICLKKDIKYAAKLAHNN